MRAILTAVCLALAGSVYARQAAPPQPPGPPPAVSDIAQPTEAAPAERTAAPPPKELLQDRVRHILDDFDQRHKQRALEMSSDDKASDVEPGVKRFADPRKVQIEIKDEQDREQASRALAKEYGTEVRVVQAQEQTLQAFLAKRQKNLDDLSKRAGVSNRQDLEVAETNLAREPGTETQVGEIRRRLADADRAGEELSARQAQDQQETASLQEEQKKLHALEQSLDKEAKAYRADAVSAHGNQLHLADRLEFFVINAQAEDVIDQDIKAAEAAPHLAPSPEVHDTLESLSPKEKAEAPPEPKCGEPSADEKGCPEKAAPAPKE